MLFLNMTAISWTSIFLFLVLALLGLWVAYSFLNKNGLFLFSILAVMLTFLLPAADFFGYTIPMSAILMPLVYFSMLVVYEKFGKLEAKRLFIYILCEICTYVVSLFFVMAYMDAISSGTALTWGILGSSISQLIAFVLVVFLSNFLVEKFPIKKEHRYLRRSILGTIASAIDLLIVIMLGGIGVLGFVDMLIIFAMSLVLVSGTSFAVCYLRKFLNREPATKMDDVKTNESSSEESENKEDVKSDEQENVEVEIENEDKEN